MLIYLPVELLEIILVDAVIATAYEIIEIIDCDEEAVGDVLTSLGDMCGLWREIVNDNAGYFRRQFWQKLSFLHGPVSK